MLSLVNNNEKYLTLNLSKKPNFISKFIVKSYTTFIPPNFIEKVASQPPPSSPHKTIFIRQVWSYNQISRSPTWGLWCWSCDIVTYHTVVYHTYHDQGSVISINLKFPTWELWCWNCDIVTYHTIVYPTYHDQGSVISINLKFRKNILQIWSSNKDYSIQSILKGKNL